MRVTLATMLYNAFRTDFSFRQACAPAHVMPSSFLWRCLRRGYGILSSFVNGRQVVENGGRAIHRSENQYSVSQALKEW
jgi:hypothetical protein